MLQLADGTIIDPSTGTPVPVETPTSVADVDETDASTIEEDYDAPVITAPVRRKLADLPEQPSKMNAIAVVAAYHLFGIDDNEIAHALNVDIEMIDRVRTTEAFTTLIDAINDNIREAIQDRVRSHFEHNSLAAARFVSSRIRDSKEDSKVRLAAANSILDRAGHRPADVHEHRVRVEGGLTIEYVKRNTNDTLPDIGLHMHMGDDEDGDS